MKPLLPILEHLDKSYTLIWSQCRPPGCTPRYIGEYEAPQYGRMHTWQGWLGQRVLRRDWALFSARENAAGGVCTKMDRRLRIADVERIFDRPWEEIWYHLTECDGA